MKTDIGIGSYLQKLRKERKMSLRQVADHIGIDVSLLSKIEHGERQLQSHMIAPLADFFRIDYKSIQIQYINQKMNHEFGNEPFIEEAVSKFLNERTK